MSSRENLRLATAKFQDVQAHLETHRRTLLAAFVPSCSEYPDHWIRSTIGQAGSVRRGFKVGHVQDTARNVYPVLQPHNVRDNRLDLRKIKKATLSPTDFYDHRLDVNDVIVTEAGGPEDTGRPAMYRGTPPNAAFSQDILRFTAGSDVLPEFALLVFRRHFHARLFEQTCRGSTPLKHLSKNRFEKIEFPIPPVHEQEERVADIRPRLRPLDEVMGIMDEQVRNLNSLEQCNCCLLDREKRPQRPDQGVLFSSEDPPS